MLIRTNSILKLDLLFTETTTHNDSSQANSMNTSIIRTIATMVDDHDSIQRYMVNNNTNNNNIKAKKMNDSEPPARILAPDKQGSSFICCTDQDEDGEEDETQAQTTSFPCSSSSESISSKTTITNYLGIHQHASTNCTDAAFASIEQRSISYQSDDDNEGAEEQLNHDWMIQDAAESDAADHVDQGSFVSFMNLNQHHTEDDKDDDTESIDEYKQRQEEEWFKGTLFYDDPGTPPMLPTKDYITINHFIDFDKHKKLYDQDSQSMYQEPTSSPSLYSLAISTKIGTSIKSRRRAITGKVRNVLKRKSIFSRA